MKRARNILKIALGILLYVVAMPPWGWWWAMPLAVAMMAGTEYKKWWQWAIVGSALSLSLYAWLTSVSVLGWVGVSVLMGILWAVPLWVWSISKNKVLTASAWVSVEWLRTFIGFGWLPVAASSVGCPALLAWARVGGEGLVGFLVIYIGLWLAEVMAEAAQGRDAKRKIIGFRSFFIGVVAILGIGAVLSLPWGVERGPTIKIGLVEPQAAMVAEGDRDYYRELDAVRQASNAVKNEGVSMILWPEQVTPWPVNDDKTMRGWVEDGARYLKTPIVAGVLWREGEKYFNAAAVIDPATGVQPAAYKKQRLVPFGEYIPWAQLGWMRSLTPIVDSFAPGEGAQILNVATDKGTVRLLPLICYEDIFDTLAWPAQGADAMVVFLNDAWFGPGMKEQHWAHSVLRAVEQGVPVIRVSNNGLSGIIEGDGRGRYLTTSAASPTSGVMELRLTRHGSLYAQTLGVWRWGFVFVMAVSFFLWQKKRKC